MKIARILNTLVLCTVLILCNQSIYAKDSKNVILVLDTSLSMLGYGGKNILDKVKGSVARYIDQLEDGDQVTFISFDTEVRTYPTVMVDDQNDRDILKKYINSTEVKGKWTHTYAMIDAVFSKAELLQNEDKNRQVVIVVMTDGIDDPPPYSTKHLNIEKISKRFQDKDWWIFFVNYSDLKKDKQLASRREKLKEELKVVSEKTEIIDVDSRMPVDKGIEEVQKKEASYGGILFPLLIALLVIAGLIGILYYFKKLSELKVSGRLEYWNNELINPTIENFDLTKYLAKDIVIGSSLGCHLNIRDFEGKSPIVISAVRGPAKEVKMALRGGGKDYAIEFKNRETGEFLEDGDVFQAKNFTFKYFKA